MSKLSYVPNPTKIKAIGIGGAGCNVITRMVREQIRGVEFIAMNSDTAHLEITEAPVRISLGAKLTHGLGSGGDQNIGRKAAEESHDEIQQAISGADMIFLAAGLGGGTGTGAIPVVAEMAKQSGALTIAAVTKPFAFEGKRRMEVAEQGINQLINKVDTLIVIPNDRLVELSDNKTSLDGAFKIADEILCQAVEAIADVITVPGLVNLDFADVRSVMKDAGPAWMSVGRGSGQNRIVSAVREALSSPMLSVSIKDAKGVLFNVIGGNSLTLFEVSDAAKIIGQAVGPGANIVFGVNVDPTMGNDVKLTLIATGFASGDLITGTTRETEINKTLKALRPEELDKPTYLRSKGTYRR